jgi:hypothetical protein
MARATVVVRRQFEQKPTVFDVPSFWQRGVVLPSHPVMG